MAVGTQLSVLRTMLNAEVGNELDEAIAPGGVGIDNQTLNNQQSFLASQHVFLLRKARVEVDLTIGTQFYPLPGGIDIDRVDKPGFVRIGNTFRYEVWFGIGQPEYNAFDSARGITGSPVRRWDLVDVAGVRKLEVWPVPNAEQTLMLSGTLPVTPMVADTDTCVIDDLLIVLFTAAERLMRNSSPDAQAKLAKANSLLASLRGSAPSRYDSFNISGAGRRYNEETKRPVVGVTLTNP